MKERRKKGEEKRDDVLPGPRATYGALAARLLITRQSRSLFPPSSSLSLSLFFFRFHRVLARRRKFRPLLRTLYGEFTRGFRLASAAEKVQQCFERKDERERGRRLRQGEREREESRYLMKDGGKVAHRETKGRREQRERQRE